MISGRNHFSLLNPSTNTPASTGTPAQINVTDQFNPFRSELKAVINIAPAVGTAGFIAYTFAAGWAVGDEVRITITSNITTRQLWRKSYTHIVEAGAATDNDVAAAMAALIAADVSVDSPYASAVAVGAVLTVTQADDDQFGLVSYEYSDSATGTITPAITLTVISEGQPSDLEDKGITADQIAAYGAVPAGGFATLKITFHHEVAIPFIDSQGATVREIYWYGTTAQAATLAGLIP